MRSRYALIAILVGVPLGWITFALVAEEDGVAAGAATGIATGLLTGGIAAGYVAWRDRVWATWAATLCMRYEEGVVHHGHARLGRSIGIDLAFVFVRAWHLLASSGIDGWLVLTTQRLVFHPRERGHNTVEIAVCDIAGVRRGDSAIPNTIEIRMHNQRSLEIRVRKRDEWLGNFAGFEGITVLR
jgi:hypothetical protein